MMKKLTPKSKISTCLVLLCLFLTQACRKDTLMPHSKDLQNGLSIAEAKSYFNKNLASLKKPDKLMSTGSGAQKSGEITLEYVLGVRQPLWEQAYQKMISTGESVKIPIDFGKAYAVVNPKTNAVVPLASLNYLFMYKDTLQKVHAEWIILQPDSTWLYGNRDTYTGHIIVKNWEGKTIRKFNYASLKTINSSSTIKGRLLSSNGKIQNSDGGENQVDDVVGFCTRWSTGKCPKTGVCATTCDMCLEVCARWTCTFFDCSPECDLPGESGGGGGGGNSGGGGGGGSKPWAPGGGGAYPPDPCGGGQVIPREGHGEVIENVVPLPPCIPIPVVLESVAKSTLIEKIGISANSLESIYLSSQPEIVDVLLLYLSTNGESAENINFAKWAVGYLMENPSVSFEDFERDVFVGPDESFVDSDADNNYTSMDLSNVGNSSFVLNGYDVYTPSQNLPDYGPNHAVSQAIYKFNPWIYYAFLGANNTSLAHFHLTSKRMDAGDGYRKALGAIGEGLFVTRLTSMPTSPPADLFVAKMLGTTHIDALVVRRIPFVNGSGYEIAINYTDLNGVYQQTRMHHPDGLTAGPLKETTIAYEVKTLNAQANTPESLYRMLQEGIKQTRHRASIPYMSAAVLVFDDQAWNKLKNSSLGSQAINEITSMSSVKNFNGEQKIYFRIEKGLAQDANRAFFGLRDKIKNL